MINIRFFNKFLGVNMRFLRAITALAFLAVLAMGNLRADEATEVLEGKVEGMDERLITAENDLSGLKKIKISGYMQINYEKSEKATGLTTSPYNSKDFIQNRFRVRRSRVKIAYDAGLTQVVVQGDYSNSGFSLKDAYITITDPWTKWFTLQTGVFNRPNFEVEYSSSQRESMERSKVIGTLYPGERDLGLMITATPMDLFKLQLATFNNTYQGTYAQNNPVFRDENLYYMARLTKAMNIDEGLDIDFGVHARIGNAVANSKFLIESDLPTNTKTLDSTSLTVGSTVPRTWFGAELQLYWDFLGGMKILGEYITGNDVNEISLSSVTPAKSIRKRSFSGFYAMLV
jgi:hypothetical protein